MLILKSFQNLFYSAQGAPPHSRAAPRALLNGFSPTQNCLIQIVDTYCGKPTRSNGKHCADRNEVVDISEYLPYFIRYLNVCERAVGEKNHDGGKDIVQDIR